MKKLLTMIIAGILTICYTMTSAITTVHADTTTDEYVNEVFKIVNQERVANGLLELKLNKDLKYVAQIRANEIVGTWGHTRPDGTKYSTILTEYNIVVGYVGENIAAGQTTPAQVMESWMNSEGHRANILNSNYTDIGIGFVKADSGYGYYWVQIFAKNPDTSNSTVPKTIKGDIDGDGSMTIIDLVILSKHIISLETGYSVTFNNADLNGDGSINVIDLATMAKGLL